MVFKFFKQPEVFVRDIRRKQIFELDQKIYVAARAKIAARRRAENFQLFDAVFSTANLYFGQYRIQVLHNNNLFYHLRFRFIGRV